MVLGDVNSRNCIELSILSFSAFVLLIVVVSTATCALSEKERNAMEVNLADSLFQVEQYDSVYILLQKYRVDLDSLCVHKLNQVIVNMIKRYSKAKNLHEANFGLSRSNRVFSYNAEIIKSDSTTVLRVDSLLSVLKLIIINHRLNLGKQCVAERDYAEALWHFRTADSLSKYITNPIQKKEAQLLLSGIDSRITWLQTKLSTIRKTKRALASAPVERKTGRYTAASRGMFLNKQGWLNPGQQDSWGFYLQNGDRIQGELFGYNDMLGLELRADGGAVPFKILSDRGTFTKVQWVITKSGDYVFVVRNVDSYTKTDYILKGYLSR